MSDLWNAIIRYEQAQQEELRREILAEIITLMAAILGFPIPPNAPDPENDPISALNSYEAACKAAYLQFQGEGA